MFLIRDIGLAQTDTRRFLMKRGRRGVVAGLTVVFIFFGTAGYSQQSSPYYQGKTITVVEGREPGGTGDLRNRTVITFLRKYIPGQPTIVSQLMPGGGGRKAANHVYLSARADGLTIGNAGSGLVAAGALGATGVQFDLNKLSYLGSPNSGGHYVFATRREAGLDSLEKLRGSSGLRIGAQTVGHTTYISGRLFALLLDVKAPRFVTGFSGPEVDVALARGEVDTRSQDVSTILRRTPEWIEKGLVHFHAILEVPKGKQHERFKHLPEIESFARSEKERKLLALFRATRLAGSTFFLPPGVPEERVKILEQAMRQAFLDPLFEKEYEKLVGEKATPLMPEELAQAIRDLPRESEVVELFNKIAGVDPLPGR